MQIDDNILQMMFININNDLFDLLIKHQINLSNLPPPPSVYEPEFNTKVKILEDCNGLDINILNAYLIEQNKELEYDQYELNSKILAERKKMEHN